VVKLTYGGLNQTLDPGSQNLGPELRRYAMVKVKTFTIPLKIYHAHEELEQLDEQVNAFLAGEEVKKVISVGDAVTTDDKGAAIGLVRVVAYKQRD
jgi:hypothetical protein